MKTNQQWGYLSSWPASGSAERCSYVFTWRSQDFTIAGSIKADGSTIFNIYEWDGTEHKLIEYGYSTLKRAKAFVDRYAAGLAPAIQCTETPQS
jgi:hypothetical protein